MHIKPAKWTTDDCARSMCNEQFVVKATLGGTGVQAVNVFQYTGTVMIVNQWAEITRVGTLTNMTNVYSTIYDGTLATDLTKDGIELSGAPVGTFFTKDQITSEAYAVNISDQGRVRDSDSADKVGRPFYITAKDGAANYIQFRYTTTDNPIDFDMVIFFEYRIMNGGSLAIVGA